MKIRSRLTLLFAIIAGVLLLLFSLVIYLASSQDREQLFRSRINENALHTARLLLQVDEIDTTLMAIIESNRTSLAQEVISVYDENNHRIYLTPNAGNPGYEKDFLDNLRMEGEQNGFLPDKKEYSGFVYRLDGKDYLVVGEAYDRYGFIKQNKLAITLAISFIVSILLTILAGWIYSGQVLRPITRVVDEVGMISASSLGTRLDTGNKVDEIAQLSITFNKMLERLEAAFEMQRSFVSNASHEFRTPLTAITGQIEVALMNEREKEEYRQILTSILDDIRELNGLQHSLLELAQASLDVSLMRLWPVRVDEVLWQAQSEVSRLHPDYNVRFRFEELPEEEKELQVLGNFQLLKSCFLNLMENGCKFSSDLSVNVTLTVGREGLTIAFRNQGEGIPPDQMPKIFQPFYRAGNLSYRQGHGLGLSLVKKIVELHRGNVLVESIPGDQTEFVVILPKLA